MPLIQGWLPPSREHWELVSNVWVYFPIVTAFQWVLQDWYPAGKTSYASRFNIPGKIAWITMEVPGFITLLYIMNTLPKEVGLAELPWGNWTMAGMFTIHYIYRAILSPILNPSMSPIHFFVWASAVGFQFANATCIGGWLAGHGPTTTAHWDDAIFRIYPGMIMWGFGLIANMYHDDDLREIRRAAARKQAREAKENGKDPQSVDKVYMIPKNGLFKWILYPHYLCEWLEWTGFWIVGGWACFPARAFLVNEITTMLPRALQGRRWYIKKFGEDKIAGLKAIIPGVL
ncbi:3-oxo-5-alpha-steroid 4-dehydrogenase [Pseudovirgaria hyperparasitica]|uniref:3-oxo-5-alpha-steroid 4-dehydrogenase n=1 Tax=Pseudovirgaria hyperparasitica TaxID=470096 RepID=A0A6A6WAD9_9PEZI|nr:3-oxo-5-alpha-steroid 4-dehydrogenase [Pseudovirgaria hyperparasitica]KAF2759822.1 3-oxo-5-alpha-steroid 4-dehydrogenase [Pseudovirgaria hyperparasitica]